MIDAELVKSKAEEYDKKSAQALQDRISYFKINENLLSEKDKGLYRLFILVKDVGGDTQLNLDEKIKIIKQSKEFAFINETSSLLYLGFKNSFLHHLIAMEDNFYFLLSISQYQLLSDMDPNLTDSEGKTPLILCAKMRNNQYAKFMLAHIFKNQININAQDEHGRSALHYAFALGNKELVDILISHGANINLTDKTGMTPIDCLTLSDLDMIRILKSVGIDPARDSNATINTFASENIPDKWSTCSKNNIVFAAKQTSNSSDYQKMLEYLSGNSLLSVCLSDVKKLKKTYLENYSLPKKTEQLIDLLLLINDKNHFREMINSLSDDSHDLDNLENIIIMLNANKDSSLIDRKKVIEKILSDRIFINQYIKSVHDLDSIKDHADLFQNLYQFYETIKSTFRNEKSYNAHRLFKSPENGKNAEELEYQEIILNRLDEIKITYADRDELITAINSNDINTLKNMKETWEVESIIYPREIDQMVVQLLDQYIQYLEANANKPKQ